MITIGTPETGDGRIVEQAVVAWEKYLKGVDLRDLINSAVESDATEDGLIHVIPTPDGLTGDFAVVDMSNVKIDTPHLHIDEHEAHVPLDGYAQMRVGRHTTTLTPGGDSVLIRPRTSHYTVPQNSRYKVGVISLPSFNPDNQQLIDLANPPQDFNSGFYEATLARLQSGPRLGE